MNLRARLVTLAGAASALAASGAVAAITCSVSVTAVNVVYDPTSPVQNVTTGSYTITCNRLASDANTLAWRLGVNNGLQPGGGFNRVRRSGGPAGQRYNYDTYRSPGNLWGDNGATRFTGVIDFAGSLTASAFGTFDIILPGSQPVDPAGTYLDTLSVELRRDTGFPLLLDTATFGVTVITTNSCQISVPPGNVSFTYTSFQAGPATANTSYGVRCTTALPYTMALDATSGTLLGLTYNLSLAPASSGNGTGATQTYSINGSIAGGQAGTCGTAVCNGSQTRTLTLSW
jgi:spore coat protein U-like protein